MNREFLEDVESALNEVITANFGKLVNSEVAYMMDFGDMTPVQQLAVIDGAIAFGACVSMPKDIEQLRQWRAELVERME